ncbi:MAG: response regulator transcription factor, partial [Chitinophagaceae bacterium]|nr:response regulator transcription factor [Chitinophagaceae bacterium]
ALSAIEVLSQEKIDLMILDINMPELSGLQLLKGLSNPPLTIIITAYPEFAIEGFELDVIDYIIKPASFERFVKAINKAKEFLELKSKNRQKEDHSYFFIKEGNRIEKINFKEVLFIESLQNYVSIQTTVKNHLTLLTLKSLEEFLPKRHFMKVQKSFIININKVNSIDGDEIIINTNRIPISPVNKEIIIKKILGNKLLHRKGNP